MVVQPPQPPYPYYGPPYPGGPVYVAPPARRKHSTADIVATILVSTIAGYAGMIAFWFSMLFAMAGDACPTHCNETEIGLAFLVTWGGLALTGLGTFVGLVVSALRGRRMWVWPALALVLIPVFFFSGLLLVDAGMHA